MLVIKKYSDCQTKEAEGVYHPTPALQEMTECFNFEQKDAK